MFVGFEAQVRVVANQKRPLRLTVSRRAAILGDIGASFFAEAELWRRKAGAGEGMVEALMYGCRRALQGALGAR